MRQRSAKVRHHIAFVIPSRFRPSAIAHHARAFPNRDQLIRRQALQGLMLATGPKYLKIRRSRRSKAEVQARIIAREKAGLAKDGLRLRLSIVMSQNSRADCTAIGLYALQLNFNPVGFSC